MNNKIINHSLSTLRIVAISSLTIFTLYSAQAWVSPTVSAPNGNVGGPLTTATSTQIKTGSLGLLDSLSIGKNLIINGGFQFATTSAGVGKVLTSDASGNASWMSASGGGLGVGQTWRDMTGSAIGCNTARAPSVTCTNSTSKPILVMIDEVGGGGSATSITIDGLNMRTDCGAWNGNGLAGWCPLSFVVPAGSTYAWYLGGRIDHWYELR